MTKTTKTTKGTTLRLTILRDRAYRAMYATEQKFGHSSPAHILAWSVFGECCQRLEGQQHSRASVADMALALDHAEAA